MTLVEQGGERKVKVPVCNFGPLALSPSHFGFEFGDTSSFLIMRRKERDAARIVSVFLASNHVKMEAIHSFQEVLSTMRSLSGLIPDEKSARLGQ